MTRNQDQELTDRLESPFPAPRRFGWVRFWWPESGRSLVLATTVLVVVIALIVLAGLQMSDQGTVTPVVSIQSVSVPLTNVDPGPPDTGVDLPTTVESQPSGTRLTTDRATSQRVNTPDQPLVPKSSPTRSGQNAREGTAAAAEIRSQFKTLDEQRAKVEFFGIRERARRIIFVIDKSSSMAGSTFARANSELGQSIRNLKRSQSFYVIYFDTGEHPMFSPNVATAPVPSTDANRQSFERWSRGVSAGGGTDPTAALRHALTLRPDAIFLLTDGEFDSAVASMLQQQNPTGRNQTTIHTLAFGSSTGVPVLKRIAKENRGRFVFIP